MYMPKIVHLVLWKIKPGAPVEKLEKKIRKFKSEIPGILELYCGPPTFFEFPSKMAERFRIDFSIRTVAHGFDLVLFIIFTDEKSRINYDTHPAHMELPNYTESVLQEGKEHVLVVDFIIE